MTCVSEHITVMTGVLGIAHALTSSHLAEEKTEGQRGSPTSEYEMAVSPYLLFSSWKASKHLKATKGMMEMPTYFWGCSKIAATLFSEKPHSCLSLLATAEPRKAHRGTRLHKASTEP